MKKKLLRFIVITSIVILPAKAFAVHLCWIDRVTKTENGLNIYFGEKPTLSALVQPNDQSPTMWYFIGHGMVGISKDNMEEDHLFVKDGYKVNLSQIAEDNCVLTAGSSGENKGILAESILHLPGTNSVQASKEFIAVDNP